MAVIGIAKHSPQPRSPPARTRARQFRQWLASPRGLIVVAIVIIGAGIALG
jgi:hypothetical protein